jgi:hypothetical protein
MASPPRGAPLKTLNVFGGAVNPASIDSNPNCRNYLWTFAILAVVWALLAFGKPSFVKNKDGSLNYQRIFWMTLIVSAIIVVGLCLYNQG